MVKELNFICTWAMKPLVWLLSSKNYTVVCLVYTKYIILYHLPNILLVGLTNECLQTSSAVRTWC